MKENIFKDAKFGDKFVINGLLDDGYVILWQHVKLNPYQLYRFHKKNPNIKDTEFIRYITQSGEIRCTDLNGKSLDGNEYYDIVSRYKEHIEEDKLNKLAYEYSSGGNHMDIVERRDFKAGYRKALE